MYESKHSPQTRAVTPGAASETPPQASQGRDIGRVRTDNPEAPPCRVHPAYALGDWGTDVARLRAESYARACTSPALVLCASTDAD